MIIEDIEGLIKSVSDSKQSELREIELDFIRECIDPPRPNELIQRIDDIQGGVPPRAIDSDPKIKEMIEPIREQLPPEVLEAPNDYEQISRISDVLAECKEILPENWEKLSLDERISVLNNLESQIAKIEHRPACILEAEYMKKVKKFNGELYGSFGYQKIEADGTFKIAINSELLKSNDPQFLQKTLDTLLHEGRHAYQAYSVAFRDIHTSRGDITNWTENYRKYGYQESSRFGFKLYWMQPVEADARKFAEDGMEAYKKKLS